MRACASLRRSCSAVVGWIGVCVLSAGPVPAAADDPKPSQGFVENTTQRKPGDEQLRRAEEQDPSDQLLLQLEAGYLADFRRGERERGYYRLDYKGKTISQSGDPISVRGAENVVIARRKEQTGDVHQLSLLLDQGAIGLSGGLLDVLGLQPLQLPSVGDWLRGTLRVSGSLRHRNLSLSGGVETKPIRLYNRLTGRTESEVNPEKLANFLVLGIAGNQQDTDDDPAGPGGTVDTAIFTYRAGVSRAWNWQISEKGVVARRRLAQRIARALRESGPSAVLRQDTLLLMMSKSDANVFQTLLSNDQLTLLERVSLLTLKELQRPTMEIRPLNVSEAAVAQREAESAAAKDEFAGAPDQWTVRAEAGLEGWYTFSGPYGIRRHQSSFFAALDYVPNPKMAERFSIQARYENGFLRASPYQRVHSFKIVAKIGF